MTREELARLEEEFIIGTKPLTDKQKEIHKHIDYIEREISLIDNHRFRLLRVWKALSVKLMEIEQ